MQEHDSKPQNPIIANVLYKSKILESWGRGIGTMVDECKRVGLPLLKLKDRVNFLKTYLAPALEEGLISMKYPKNPKHPGQKYMLTEKGKASFYFCIKCFKFSSAAIRSSSSLTICLTSSLIRCRRS